MSSTGNDIIALHAIDKKRTRDTGFYSKIISVEEEALYELEAFASMPFEHFVWLLWSVKESVYKYEKRTDTDLIFSPTRIIVGQIDLPSGSGEGFCTGTVCHGTAVLYFRSKIHPEYIATVVAGEEGFDNVWWGVQRIDDPAYAHQSKMVRDLARQRLNTVCPGDDLYIGKSPSGYPVVLQNGREMKIPVSFAHHGCFVAYSFSGLPAADLAGILPDEGLPSRRFLTT